MRFEWDDKKNQANRAKHGMDFGQAAQITALIVEPDVREDYGEERWIGLGLMGGTVVALAFTLPSEEVIRILSLRKADQDEQESYYRQAFGR
jgi:uncharacterized DUF497 family protein